MISDAKRKDILSTERRYRGLKHVPPHMSATQVHVQGHGEYDPNGDEEMIRKEVEDVLTGARYALQVATQGHRPTVYCPSEEVLRRVVSRLSADEINRMILSVQS